MFIKLKNNINNNMFTVYYYAKIIEESTAVTRENKCA